MSLFNHVDVLRASKSFEQKDNSVNFAQRPLSEIIVAVHKFSPVAGFNSFLKYIPGDRINWLTIILSHPVIKNVPCSVINGISDK